MEGQVTITLKEYDKLRSYERELDILKSNLSGDNGIYLKTHSTQEYNNRWIFRVPDLTQYAVINPSEFTRNMKGKIQEMEYEINQLIQANKTLKEGLDKQKRKWYHIF